ncbi:hypothetical protein Tco_0484966 [Tanacetum coccineum]
MLKRLKKVGEICQVVSFEDEGLGDQEDTSKQGRKIADIDANTEEFLDEQELKAKPKAVTTAAYKQPTTDVTIPKSRGVCSQELSTKAGKSLTVEEKTKLIEELKDNRKNILQDLEFKSRE